MSARDGFDWAEVTTPTAPARRPRYPEVEFEPFLALRTGAVGGGLVMFPVVCLTDLPYGAVFLGAAVGAVWYLILAAAVSATRRGFLADLVRFVVVLTTMVYFIALAVTVGLVLYVKLAMPPKPAYEPYYPEPVIVGTTDDDPPATWGR